MGKGKSKEQPQADQTDDKKTDKPKVAKPANRGRTFSGGGVEKRG